MSPLGLRLGSRTARRLIFAIVLFSSAITLVATAIQLYAEYRDDLDLIDRRLEQVRTSYLQGLTQAVWVADREQIRLILAGIVELPDVVLARVVTEHGDTIAAGRPAPGDARRRVFDLNYDYRGRPRHIGRLEVEASLAGVYARLWRRVWTILVSNGIKTFLVALFTLFLFDRLVTRHLARVAAFVTAPNLETDAPPLKLDRPPHPPAEDDELDMLTQAINRMRENLQRSFRALRESEQRVRLLLDSTAEAIYGMDLEGRCTFVNPACLRMLGYDRPEDLVGQPMHERIRHSRADGTPYPAADCAIRRAMAAGEPAHSDQEVHWRADGTCFPVEWWCHPIRQDGRVTGAVVAFVDITRRRQDEAELARYRERLEVLVRERTEALESFMYSVSHDLRAPLRAIDGFSRILEEDHGPRLDDEARRSIERIRVNTRRMGQMIDDLLNLSRLSRQPTRTQVVDLSAMAAEVVAELREREPGREVEVRIQPGMQAEGDPGLLRLLLQNLLDNAWKYTAGRSPAVIEFGNRREGDETVFFVRDNGAGFNMEHADKLFRPFQRLHGDEFEGSGVGLATVRRIVQRHGGRIWGECGDGGTVFSFTLPGETVQLPGSASASGLN